MRLWMCKVFSASTLQALDATAQDDAPASSNTNVACELGRQSLSSSYGSTDIEQHAPGKLYADASRHQLDQSTQQ